MKYNIQEKFIVLLWFLLCASINVYPVNIFEINSLLDLVNSSRILLPIFLGFILIIIFFLKFDFKKPKIYSLNFLNIFLLIFITQAIGSLLIERNSLEDFYLIIFSFITILLFLLIENLELHKIYKILLFIIIIYISVAIVFLFLIKFETFKLYFLSGSFYGVFHPDVSYLGQSSLRASGFSRLVAVISLFLIIFSEIIKNNFYKFFIYLINTVLALIIWMFQSRGTILCYFSSILIITLIFNFRNGILYKLQTISLTILFPIIFSFLITSFFPFEAKTIAKIENNLENKNNKEITAENNIDEVIKNNKGTFRIINNFTSTGRIGLWVNSINFYDKTKIFGYGSQADRIILSYVNEMYYANANPYGNNVSNGLIYSFLSGGYFSLILFFLLYVINLTYGLKLLKIILNKKIEPLIKFSSILIFFFSLRSIFENSYAVFGVDFLLMFIGISILKNFFSRKQKI